MDGLQLNKKTPNDIHLDEAIRALLKASPMNLLDIIIIVIMVFLIVRGLFRGFFMEVASFAGVILGIVLGLRLNPEMTELLMPHLSSFKPFIIQLTSFTVIFTIVLVLCNIIGWGLKIILKKTALGWADRVLGAGLAVLKGVLIINLIIVLLSTIDPLKAPLVAKSKLAPWMIDTYQSARGLIPPKLYEKWKPTFMGDPEKSSTEKPPKSIQSQKKDEKQKDRQ
jgi:membrane protein required for colicin V production